MSNYEIKIEISIQKTETTPTNGVESVSDLGFRMVISRDAAQNIDASEKALLMTNYPALRQALSQHLSAISRENAEALRFGHLKKTTFIR
ncbi:MAG: hypothetical protein HQM12_18215 [SAR324 cluster bacterium]|nr:hypothetical protein [SAR324 cluster bacterium]